MADEMDFATRMGKQAAEYSQSFLVPPKKKRRKRTTSHSRTFKLGSQKEKDAAETATQSSAGNVQPPHRYGRRIKP